MANAQLEDRIAKLQKNQRRRNKNRSARLQQREDRQAVSNPDEDGETIGGDRVGPPNQQKMQQRDLEKRKTQRASQDERRRLEQDFIFHATDQGCFGVVAVREPQDVRTCPCQSTTS